MKPKLHVKRPCGESPESMLPVDGGLHCERCNHVVVDFRTWSDEAIAGFLRNNSAEKTCGIFLPTQAAEGSPKLNWRLPLRAAAVVAAALLGSTAEVKAQVQQIQTAAVSGAVNNDSVIWRITGYAHTNSHSLRGRRDHYAQELTIRVYDSSANVVAEAHPSYGKFTLLIPAASRDEHFTILFTGKYYRDHHIRDFNPDGQSELNVLLKLKRGAKLPSTHPFRTVGCPSF